MVPLGQAGPNAFLGARRTHARLGHRLGSSTQKREETGGRNSQSPREQFGMGGCGEEWEGKVLLFFH